MRTRVVSGGSRCVVVGMVLLMCLTGRPALADKDHSFINNYKDATTCLTCHNDKAGEVMDSVHYQWRSENPLVEYPGGGSHGMLDRACGLVGSNALVNYGQQCGRCHVGDSLPFPDPQTGMFTDVPITLTPILLLLILTTAGPFFLYNYAMQTMSVGRVSLFGPLSGPIGAIIATLVFDEPMHALIIVAIAMSLGGALAPTLAARWRARA